MGLAKRFVLILVILIATSCYKTIDNSVSLKLSEIDWDFVILTTTGKNCAEFCLLSLSFIRFIRTSFYTLTVADTSPCSISSAIKAESSCIKPRILPGL